MNVQPGRLGIGKDSVHATADIDNENADGEQCRELDNSLEGNRGHNTVVLLLGIHVAGAEQDCEHGHARGYAKRQPDLVPTCQAAAPEFGRACNGFDRGGYGL